MTQQKHFKQLVLSRMQKTGESYTTARRQVMAQVPGASGVLSPQQHFPGNVPASTALRSLLAHASVRAPHTGAPFTEAMVFGLAGGIGAGMFSFHYAKANFSSFFVAGRHLWHDHTAWALAAAKRMGLTAVVKESSGMKPAEKNLRELLGSGRPVMAWLDATGLPYRGGMYHVSTVYAIDDATGTALVGDLGDTLVPIELPVLAEARGRNKKDKNRLLALEPRGKTSPFAVMVRDGIRACAGSLTQGRIKNFTLEAFATWADRLDGSRAADSWEKIFPPGPRLFTGLRSIAEYVEYYGTGGGLCRPIFAEFLDEAARALDDPGLARLSERYAALGRGWSELASAALPDDVPEFREAREMLGRKTEIVTAESDVTGASLTACSRAMADAVARMQSGFPLDATRSAALRRDLKRRVTALYEGEMDAAGALTQWL